MCPSDTTLKKMMEYPIIIKMNGPLKTEFRREMRNLIHGLERGESTLQILKKITRRNVAWLKGGLYISDWNQLHSFKRSIGESVLNEVKQFPVEFDKEGNLIIHKAKFGMLSFGDEIDDSVKLLQVYRNTNNIEGMKYELAKLWFINDAIEKKLTRRNLTDNQYKELVIHRATCLNVFKTNLEYVLKAEKGFNFAEYYNSTPFSDNSIKITNDTLKYSLRTIASVI